MSGARVNRVWRKIGFGMKDPYTIYAPSIDIVHLRLVQRGLMWMISKEEESISILD